MPIRICILLIIGITTACTPRNQQPPPPELGEDSILHTRGTVYLENQDVTILSAPCDGRLISVNASTGQMVNSGRSVAKIENNDILILQKEYLDAASELEFCSLEYARQGDLTVENATSMKRLETARHAYQEADLKYQGYRKQLVMLGLNPDSIRTDNIRGHLSVVSPGKGIITESNAQKGKFVKKGDMLFIIARDQSMLIKLIIPEKMIWKLHKNQRIIFYSISDTAQTMEAFVLQTVQQIDPETQTGEIIAKPVIATNRLLPGMSVKATIFLTDSHQ